MAGFPKPFLLIFIFSLKILPISAANDTLITPQTITDQQTLSSAGGIFELGFFTPANSTNWYLGIWYRNIPVRTYVWVANRDTPLTNNSGVLTYTPSGNLTLLNGPNGVVVWSSNATRSVGNATARLLDSGNLILKDGGDDNFVWQSFDYPTDTFLPGTSLGWNYVTGVESYVQSWKSESDPGRGEYSVHLDPTGYPQMISRRGNTTVNRLGPWNGVRFSGAPDTSNDRVYTLALWLNRNEVKYREDSSDPSVLSRSYVRPSGDSARWIWTSEATEWTLYRPMASDNCDGYNLCGANGLCTIGNSPPCGCLNRFVSRNPTGWIGTDRNNGCVRRTQLNCTSDVFLPYPGIKLPDAQNSTVNDRIVRLADCEAECSRNCNCTAYAQLNISGSGSGCLYYHGELIDIRTISTGDQNLFIRMAASEREAVARSKRNTRVALVASLVSVAGIGILCLILFCIFNRKRKKHQRLGNEVAARPFSGNVVNDSDLPFFSLSAITQATDHFANNNKLGEGGFGPVYRGKLEDGREIAVKRLSKTSTQGIDELKNEVILIAKLQHRNLVRTLGCCAEGEENMLVYEYMPNKSLDCILFGKHVDSAQAVSFFLFCYETSPTPEYVHRWNKK